MMMGRKKKILEYLNLKIFVILIILFPLLLPDSLPKDEEKFVLPLGDRLSEILDTLRLSDIEKVYLIVNQTKVELGGGKLRERTEEAIAR